MAVEERDPGFDFDAPGGRRLNAAPSRLPPLVGREVEFEALRARLLDRSAGLVTVVGPGGCGKTRLARAVAASLQPSFPDGIWFVDLAPLWDASDVLPAIAFALSVQEAPAQSIGPALTEHLAGRRLLLVLDNFEHVTAAAADLAALIEPAPGTACLVTSRTALRLYGEQEFPLDPLPLPPGETPSSAEAIGRAPSVQLFVRAVQMLRPDFALTDANAATVAAICMRLDGLPLALELAAARMKVLTPDALLRRLEGAGSPFQVLTSDAPNMPARLQTLRNAIAWSHALLTPAEQCLFRRLAVFTGGAGLDTIEAVCCDPLPDGDQTSDPLDLLTSLVNQSLLRQTESEGEPRFDMLATIREFALEQLECSGDAGRLRERHARVFVELAEAIEPKWDQPVPSQAPPHPEREHANLRAALTWSMDAGKGSDAGLRLTGALWRYWKQHGRLSEGRGWISAALESGPPAPSVARVKALLAAGVLAYVADDLESACGYLEEAATIAHALGEIDLRARALNKLACVAAHRGEYARERALYEECRALWGELGNQVGVAKALNGLGEAARLRGDYPAARSLYEEGLALVETSEPQTAATILHNLGYVAGHEGDHRMTAAYFQGALDLIGTLSDEVMIGLCVAGLAGAAAATGDPERAVRLFGAADGLRRRIGGRIDPADRPAYERNLEAARAMLSPRSYASAWEDGQRLTVDAMVGEARLVNGAPRAVHEGDDHRGLTRREREVAALVAQGLTNRQIAAALTIAERTVGTHVEHIMSKLDCHSRAQIAAWMAEHRPLPFPDTDPLQVA